MKNAYKPFYIIAAVVSIILYVIGIATGIYISSTANTVENEITSIKSDIEKVEQEYVLFGLRGKESCSVLSSLTADIESSLDSVVKELIRLENEGEKGAKFTELKKVYATLSIRAWILRSAINENCEQHVIPILYYYSIPCTGCEEQGRILDEARARFDGNISVYVLDNSIELPIVETLVRSHNAYSAPTVVIGDKIKNGLANKTDIENEICSQLNTTC